MFKINFSRICAHIAIKKSFPPVWQQYLSQRELLSYKWERNRNPNDGRGNRESLRKEENKELLRYRMRARQEKLAGWFLEGRKKKVRRTVGEWTLSHSQTVDLDVFDENSPSVLGFYSSLWIEIHVKRCCFWNIILLKVKIAVIRAVLQEAICNLKDFSVLNLLSYFVDIINDCIII